MCLSKSRRSNLVFTQQCLASRPYSFLYNTSENKDLKWEPEQRP